MMNKGQNKNKNCNWKYPLNIGWWLKSEAYTMQGKQALEARNIW
jgi:hypothetical protein